MEEKSVEHTGSAHAPSKTPPADARFFIIPISNVSIFICTAFLDN